MAIAYFGSAKSESASTRNSISVPIGSIASIPAGAIIVVAIQRRQSTTGEVITMAGYTPALRHVASTSNNMEVLYKVAAGGDGNVTASWTTAVVASAVVSVYTGVDTGAVWIGENGAVDGSASSTATTPVISNTSASAWGVVAFGTGISDAGAQSWTYGAGVTKRQDADSSASTSRANMSIGDTDGAIATGNQSYTATFSGSTSNIRKTAWLGVLNPAAATSSTAFVATSTPNTGTTTTVTNSLPSASTGDLVVICVAAASNGAAPTYTWGSGWTLVPNSRQTRGSAPSITVEAYYRILQAGDSAPTLTLSSLSSGSWISASAAYSGVDATTPIAASNGSTRAGASTSFATPSVTGSASVWRLSAFTSVRSLGNTTWSTYSSGDTERADAGDTTATRRASLAIADSNRPIDSTSGTTASATPSGAGDNDANVIILLNPPSGASATNADAGQASPTATAYGATVTSATASAAGAVSATAAANTPTVSTANATNASAGHAAATATTNATTPALVALSGAAAATAAASDASSAGVVGAPAGAASASAGVVGAGASGGILAGTGAATAAAYDATTANAASASAGSAAATGVADNATVSTANIRNADAGHASTSASSGQPVVHLNSSSGNSISDVIAYDATVSTAAQVSAPAGTATTTGVANDPSSTISASAGTSPVGVVASNATVSTASNISATAGQATASATAENATINTSGSSNVPAGHAAATVTANDASVTSTGSTNAQAGTATATATADSSTGALGAAGGTGAATATANDATVSTVGSGGGTAGHAIVSGTAEQSTITVRSSAGTGSANATANNATVSSAPATNAPAGPGSASATANSPMIVIRSSAGEVLATAATIDALAVLQAAADVVGVSATANDAMTQSLSHTAAQAGIALAAVVAFNPDGQGNKQDALTELAGATASAYAATVLHISPTPRARVYRV